MTDKLRQWLRYNAILLPFIAMGLVIFAQSLSNQLGMNQPKDVHPRVEVAQFLMGQDMVTLYQEDDALVAELKQTIKQKDATVTETKFSRFLGAFKPGEASLTPAAAQGQLRERYRDYLLQLARYQRETTRVADNFPVFGVSPYSEVQKMKVNGQPIQQQLSYQDAHGQTWYVWFYDHLQLSDATNTIEFEE